MTELTARTPAPDFSLPDQDGKIHTLKENLGKWAQIVWDPI